MSHKAIDALKARFKDQVNSEAGRLVLVEGSEEMLGEPLYTRKAITANRKNRIFKAEKDGILAFMAEIIVQAGYNENGALMFTANQRQELIRHCSSEDIETLGGAISNILFGDDDELDDEDEKPSKKAERAEEKAAKN